VPKDAGHVHQREEMDPLALLEQGCSVGCVFLLHFWTDLDE